MEKIAYVLLGIVAVAYLIAMIVGMIIAFPYGIIGLIALLAVGLLVIKIFKERKNNPDDEYYSKNIDK
ncbi:MAG: hypothetical protein GF384_05890 [Elusimicrobia bacterium]|nr:hypothetical protein [Elusimicrobiota bacterium]